MTFKTNVYIPLHVRNPDITRQIPRSECQFTDKIIERQRGSGSTCSGIRMMIWRPAVRMLRS